MQPINKVWWPYNFNVSLYWHFKPDQYIWVQFKLSIHITSIIPSIQAHLPIFKLSFFVYTCYYHFSIQVHAYNMHLLIILFIILLLGKNPLSKCRSMTLYTLQILSRKYCLFLGENAISWSPVLNTGTFCRWAVECIEGRGIVK